MEKRVTKMIDKVISSLDWDFIFEVNRCFKMGVGEGTTAIPGIKRKGFSEELTKSDLKSELKSLLKYVINEGLPEIYYGAWMIYWADSKWVTQKYGDNIEIELEGDEGEGIQIELDVSSTLEVIYSPQRVCVISDEISEEIVNNEDSDAKRLESMLKKALDSENYELATMIRDVIKLQKDGLSEDK